VADNARENKIRFLSEQFASFFSNGAHQVPFSPVRWIIVRSGPLQIRHSYPDIHRINRILCRLAE